MILTDCKVCGSANYTVALDISHEKDTYLDYLDIDYIRSKRRYVKCNDCGLIYRNIILNKKEKELLYDHFRDIGLRNETKKEYFDRITSLPKDESENFEKCKFLSSVLSSIGNLSVLDVGCGAGVFLYSFKEFYPEWEVFGVEPTKDFSDIAKDNNITILNKYLDYNAFDRKFGLIVLNHVLEHIDDYHNILSLVLKYVETGGFVYIEVPSDKDIGFLSPSHDRFMCQHDVIFSEKTLSMVVLSAGFEIVTISSFLSIRGRNNIRILLRKKGG